MCQQGLGRNGNPHALWMGMQIGAATVESSMKLPQKIKNISGSIPGTSGNISEETQSTNSKECM